MKNDGFQIKSSSENTNKTAIYIPNDEACVYILGHKIDGFESFEEFLKYLNRFMEIEEENVILKENWNNLKEYLKNYKKEKENGLRKDENRRYCVALSIDDILEKIDEFERN